MTPRDDRQTKKLFFHQLPVYAFLTRSLSKTQKLFDFNETWFPSRFEGPDLISGVNFFFSPPFSKWPPSEWVFQNYFKTVRDSIYNVWIKNVPRDKTYKMSPRSVWFGWAVLKWRPFEVLRNRFFAYNFWTVTDSIVNMCMKNDSFQKIYNLSPRSAWFGWAVLKWWPKQVFAKRVFRQFFVRLIRMT